MHRGPTRTCRRRGRVPVPVPGCFAALDAGEDGAWLGYRLERVLASAPMADRGEATGKRSVGETFSRLRELGKVREFFCCL